MDKKPAALKRLYTTVYSQCFSPCGRYLAVCDNYGEITVFHIPLSDSGRETSTYKPCYRFQASKQPIYSLTSNEKFLICGSTGTISAFEWNSIISKSAEKASWSLDISTGTNYDIPEVNAIIYKDDMLYAGCGDSQLHVWDLDSGKLKSSYKGHKNYIHDIALWKNCFVSASEDGTVLLWDERSSNEPESKIEPNKNEKCARPQIGNWLSCVAVDETEEWLVCGGGPKMSMWHLQSMSCTTIFDRPGYYENFVSFHDDGLVSGGNAGEVEHWSIDGTLRAQVACKTHNVFNICVNEKKDNEKAIVTVAGGGADVDVFFSIAYPEFCLAVR